MATLASLPFDKPRSPAREAPRRIRLSCDEGNWVLADLDPARRFNDIETALDCARGKPDTAAATVEIWQSGQYICCLPPQVWLPRRTPQGKASDAREPAPPRVASRAERGAQRAATTIFGIAGPFFWGALLVALIAATLGGHLALL